ncbi:MULTISPECIES: hypothetical protein [unclassified Pseudonocardia]|uniref:hypothetical protein n=1 Tax=unclassified Pseudonocardia TaxID=2619320 RepID=UPI0011151791|nr:MULTISPECIES: hypothetical protein [unclassified Pseudonocardia]
MMPPMPRRSSGRAKGRPSKGSRVVIFPRLPLAVEAALKDLAARRGLTWSEVGADLVSQGLQRVSELPATLPARYTAADSSALTVRIPVADNVQVRALARDLDRNLSIVSGALIEIGLRHAFEMPGQIPVQYMTTQERPLTKAS